MKNTILLLSLCALAGCSEPSKKAKDLAVVKHVDQIDMVLMHCQHPNGAGERIEAWPSGYYFAPRYTIEAPLLLDTIEKFEVFLATRPAILRKRHRLLRTVERDGWYVAHVAMNEGDEIGVGIMRAFAVEVGTTKVCYWFSW